MDCADR
jgi:hypothetical protein